MNIFDAINQTMADQSGYGEAYPTIPAEEVSDRLRESNEELVEINATILADDAIRVTEYAEASKEFKASLESAGYTLDQIEANEVSDEAIKDAAIRGAYKVKGGLSRALQNIIKIVSNIFKFNSAVNADLNNMKNEIKEAKKKLEKASINSEKEFKLHTYNADACGKIVGRILATGANNNINAVITSLNGMKSEKTATSIISNMGTILKNVSALLLRADKDEAIAGTVDDTKVGELTNKTKAEAFRDEIKDSDYLSDLKDYLNETFNDKDDSEYTGASAKSHMMKELGKFEGKAWMGANRDAAKFAKLSKTLETVKSKLDSNFFGKESNATAEQVGNQEALMIAVGALGQCVVLHRKGAAMAMKAVKEEINRLVTETVKVYAGAKKVS